MRELINFFVRRPVTVVMILCAQIIAAVFFLSTMSINRLPDFSTPRVTVETVYSGMAASEIRTLVTIPLEDGLSPIKGLERIRSVSRDNRSLVSMDFRWGTDPMAAAVLVREAIDAVYPSLPDGVRKPAVTAGDSVSEPHAVIAVSSHSGEFARNLAEYELRARFRKIDGVGSIVLVGGQTAEERLSLDAPRLAALGLSPSQFAELLSRETSDIPAGNAREGNMELVVVASGKPDSKASLANVTLPAAKGTLTVRDAGELVSVSARRESVFVHDGKEATALEIYRRPGSDPLRLSREIRKTAEEAASLFSREAKIEIVADAAPSLVSGLKGLLISASLGAAAVFTILLIFIRRLKYSLLAALSIPFSAAAGICALGAAGKSLNSMSLGGLAMGIGFVSDVSVIVLDLLHRSFSAGSPAVSMPAPSMTTARQISDKASSIAGSSAASTITTVLVFVPIITLPGPLGSLFGDISIALASSVFAGWLYAQFCLPSLYRITFKEKTNEAVKKLQLNINSAVPARKYRECLLRLLKNPKRAVTLAALLCLAGGSILLTRPVVFIDPDAAEEVWVSITFPPGTLLETSSGAGVSITNALLALPTVKNVYGRAGAEEEDSGRRADIDYKKEELILRCALEKRARPEKALTEINAAMASSDIPYSVYFPKDKTEILLGLSQERTFAIKGKDREELLERKQITENALEEKIETVNFRPMGQRPELRFFPDREAAAYLSIPASLIAETMYALNEGFIAATLEIAGRPLDVRVTGAKNPAFADPVKTLEEIPLLTAQGNSVYLGSLGRIERKEAEAALARLDRSDVIYADIASGKKPQAAAKEIAARFPWLASADESVFNRYKNSILLYVALVLILLYMAMGAQFESFLLPLILMISIPFSLAGAGPALLITGSKIDSGAALGLTALFGLVVNNSLILFEISEQKIRLKFTPAAAVLSGASERFQAILITAATTVFALLPLVISPMGNAQKSMASAMLGGLTASTFLSLFVIPPVLIKYFKWKLARGEAK